MQIIIIFFFLYKYLLIFKNIYAIIMFVKLNVLSLTEFYMNFLIDASNTQLSFFDKLGVVFSNYRPIWDTLDIILIALLFFATFRYLKTRKAVAILLGVAFFLAVMTLSYALKLNGMLAITSAIASGGPIILVIVFQQEIRDFLERIGSSSIKGVMSFSDRKKKKERYSTLIDSICTAVNDLSGECTGALIVIERTTRLSDVVDSGVVINADVNVALIKNLFYNKAPLHDGAMIISDGKIHAAGCFLPLTRRTDLNSDLGTRHRAALGMAESSDAIVIVVSEETGTISLAVDGSLERNLTAEEVKQFLLKNLLRGICNTAE